MKLVRQPNNSTLCGQACIATICNITLEQAIIDVGKKGKTKTKDLIKGLKTNGVICGNRRKNGWPKGNAILFYKIQNFYHWVLWYNKKFYDPNAGIFKTLPNYLKKSKYLSHLPLVS